MTTIEYAERRTQLGAKDDFAARLRNVIQFRQTSQAAVARALGVKRASVNAWCSGVAIPKRGNLEALARVLEVDEGYLLGRDSGELAQLLGSAEFLRVHDELKGLATISEAQRAESLLEIAEFIRFVRNRKPAGE